MDGCYRLQSQSDGTRELCHQCLTDLAFSTLGADGKITAANGHACGECSHLQHFGPEGQHLDPQDYDPVNMCVVDGIVMAPTVCTIFISQMNRLLKWY